MVSDIPAGDGKIANLFLQCSVLTCLKKAALMAFTTAGCTLAITLSMVQAVLAYESTTSHFFVIYYYVIA
jgi:hypothetical protein